MCTYFIYSNVHSYQFTCQISSNINNFRVVFSNSVTELRQSHTTIATVEKITDGTYVLKALKQKLFVDGLCYLLQEIYGIENKNNDKVRYSLISFSRKCLVFLDFAGKRRRYRRQWI